jgi:hypothetical protein
VTVAEAGIGQDELRDLKAERTADGRSRASEEEWWGTYSAIRVAFDEDGRVIRKCFIDVPWN